MKVHRMVMFGMALVGVLGFAGISSAQQGQSAMGEQLLPPAKPGECYARVFVPPTYKSENVDVQVREESYKIEIIPAKYEWVEESILVKEGYEKLEIVPAEYNWVEEQVLVSPEVEQLRTLPADYAWEEEKVLSQPAHTVWKRGQNPLQMIDGATGEIICLIEVPEQYKTVRKQVVSKDASTQPKVDPAKYETIKKRVVTKPETTRKITVPSEYKTVKVRKLASPPQEKRIKIPAEHKTITKRALVTDGHMEWRAILCETNMRAGIVTDIQRALKSAGYNPGDIDGVMGRQTVDALDSYQRAKGLAQGGLTIEVLRSLGIKLDR